MLEKSDLPTNVELHFDEDGEWSALYIDGKLDSFGDSYQQEERIQNLFGVKVVQDSPWLLGGNGRNREPAQTVEDIETYRSAAKEDRLDAAAKLREKADELVRAARDLEANDD